MTETNATTKDMLLPVVFGKTSNGEIVTRDLARLPHLLIGGLTGSGKSVFLHSLICSLVQNHSPEHVRFVLMDPKRVEFGAYAKLPHLYSPIAHEPEQGVSTSCLQRQLNIGYNDAEHVMSLLEERGIIGPVNDKGSREIQIEDS